MDEPIAKFDNHSLQSVLSSCDTVILEMCRTSNKKQSMERQLFLILGSV